MERTVSVPGDFSFSEDPGLPQVLSSILKADVRFLHCLIHSCSGYTKSSRFGPRIKKLTLAATAADAAAAAAAADAAAAAAAAAAADAAVPAAAAAGESF